MKPNVVSADVLFEEFRGLLKWEWVAGLGASERRFDEVAVRSARSGKGLGKARDQSSHSCHARCQTGDSHRTRSQASAAPGLGHAPAPQRPSANAQITASRR